MKVPTKSVCPTRPLPNTQLRGRLKDEGRQNERVMVVTDRMRMQLMQVGLPYMQV